MEKIKVNGKYIDRIIEYLNELLDLKKGNDPESCGFCDAANDSCAICPLSEKMQNKCCSNRAWQLRASSGRAADEYDQATKSSIRRRVKWLAEQVNEHCKSGWEIVIK